MTTALVEGFAPDARALAGFLAGEGVAVRLAGPGVVPAEARSLATLGVLVEGDVDLDADPGSPDVAFLDVWTPEVAPRVRLLRERGTQVSCLGDLVLERARGMTLGVTGTAGKSTTTAFVVELLRRAGRDVVASTTGPAGNGWPAGEHLDRLDVPGVVVALELTSSHLAFVHHPPDVAVITSFWPDHVELHGSLAAYRAAKEQIVRGQTPEHAVVVPADDPEAGAFADLTPAGRWHFSTTGRVDHGAYLDDGRLVATDGAANADCGPAPPDAHVTRSALAAIAAALACGVPVNALAKAEGPGFARLPGRGVVVGRRGGIELVDDGMAATPTKAAAGLRRFAPGTVVLVAGGRDQVDGRRVHASPEESELLEEACDVVARVAARVVLVGEAADRLGDLLAGRGVASERAADPEQAIETATRIADETPGVRAVVCGPMFPLTLGERETIRNALIRSTRS